MNDNGIRYCPECGQTFLHGWHGLGAHWNLYHKEISPYCEELHTAIMAYTVWKEAHQKRKQ